MVDIDPIMQAAEYIRKHPQLAEAKYRASAELLLSILPKGKRPVAISQQPVDCDGEDRNQVWMGELDDTVKVLEEVCPCVECMGIGVAGMFATEADIRLELDYRSLERHIATISS